MCASVIPERRGRNEHYRIEPRSADHGTGYGPCGLSAVWRVGVRRHGPRSAAIANILVGNPEDEAVLECTMMGPQLLFNQAETIAITGGDLMPTLDGQPMPTYRAVTVQAGQVLRFQAPKTGCAALLPSPADWISPR